MKKAILSLLVFSFGLFPIFGQASKAKSPFSKLGYKKQVMFTSSKGEFEEFHNNADIVEIGSVYFNTKTNEVVGFVDEKKEKTEVTSATSAMSIDPLCEKYYWISPYAYCMDNPVRFIDPTGMDWYESKEGKVMWINETNDEMKKQVKGWKHLGDTYKGFTVKTYEAYDATDGSSQSAIEISYKSPDGDKSKGWVQTINSNAPKEGEDPQTIDPPKGQKNDNFPYYDSKGEFQQHENFSKRNGYDTYFADGANRLKSVGDFYFNAELSLIKMQTVGQTLGYFTYFDKNYLRTLLGAKDVNVFSPIATFRWGFYRQNGVTHLLPLVLTNPSAFQSNAIGQIKQ